ncbi:hypothetical protein AUR04nite_04130 [Glutamicibacter uratoxydans]|uniref:VOC domain-containing protein n=2 Tax=Glutamicibacter uratoxydans TaxID=43667 RepID=A0A4Y4DQW2_GLUUR|nr:hypothetical protein AUR04nite_04130 [Glutamicibacter uratoxydans]
MPGFEPPAAEPCWVDLLTSDVERAIEFYGALFGWEPSEKSRNSAVVEMRLDGKPVTGLLHNDQVHQLADVWTTYLNVADIHAAVFSVQMHGGVVYLEPTVTEHDGTVAVVGDPSGVGVGLWQSIHPILTTATGRPGTRIWNELHTTSFAAATRFYRAALAWELYPISDTDQFRYQSFRQGADAKAGIFDISGQNDPEPGWRTYFAVANADATVELAVKLGAQIVRAASDSPFGRMAVIKDPTGAEFSIMQTLPRS